MCLTRTLFTIIVVITCIDRHELDLIKGHRQPESTVEEHLFLTYWSLTGPKNSCSVLFPRRDQGWVLSVPTWKSSQSSLHTRSFSDYITHPMKGRRSCHKQSFMWQELGNHVLARGSRKKSLSEEAVQVRKQRLRTTNSLMVNWLRQA